MVIPTGRERGKAYLGDVPGHKILWCRNGKMIKNLKELAGALSNMSEQTFSHHVTRNRNDFSRWVREAIGDVILANQLQRQTCRVSMSRDVISRIKWLDSL